MLKKKLSSEQYIQVFNYYVFYELCYLNIKIIN